jgi:hypothetical protein
MKTHSVIRTLLALSLFFIAGCADDDSGNNGIFDPSDASGSDVDGDNGDSIRLFSDEIGNVVLEVDYEDGAAPYTGGGLLSDDPWTIFEANADELFAVSNPTFEIPTETSGMQNIGAVTDENLSSDEILDIAGDFRDTETAGSTASFYVLFVDGYFEDGGERNEQVIGVSIGRTGVIAMFKPVIRELGSSDSSRAKGEQATLVHEFGHAVGLVNNPIPPQSEHHDEENGAHCTNEDCVMYWLNERPNELASFIGDILIGGSGEVLFDSECIDDIRAVSSE